MGDIGGLGITGYIPQIIYNPTLNEYFLNDNIVWPYNPYNVDNYIDLGTNAVFNGNGYTISFLDGFGANFGIFYSGSTGITDDTIPYVKNLTIKSTVLNQTKTSYSAGFFRYGSISFGVSNCHHIGVIAAPYGGAFATKQFFETTMIGYVHISECTQTGNLLGMSSGGIIGGGIANDFIGNHNTINVLIEKCIVKGNGLNDNIGGIIGGPAIANLSNSSITSANLLILNVTITDCKFEGELTGDSCGGILGGKNNNQIIGQSDSNGGCIANNVNGNPLLISVNILNCNVNCIFNGSNNGGICGGGESTNPDDYIIGCGAGCIGNYSDQTTNITVNISDSNVEMIGSGNNNGGICAGGDNYSSYGGGCICNYSNAITNVKFNNLTVNCNLSGKNCGGICAGGDNLTYYNDENSIGGGCIGNACLYGNINVLFSNIKVSGNITGYNSGGLCGGGNNDHGNYGSGCIANYTNDNNVRGFAITIPVIILVSFSNCETEVELYGNSCGGLLAGGTNYGYGGGCISNNAKIYGNNTININVSFIDCKSTGNIIGDNVGGICGGGMNYFHGGGCLSNNMVTDVGFGDSSVTLNTNIIFNNCRSHGLLTGKNSGGICGGGDNNDSGTYTGAGGGCIGNYINSKINEISIINLNVSFTNCKSYNNINGNNSGGICGGGDNGINKTSSNPLFGSGCISNASVYANTIILFDLCESYKSIIGNNSGGICGGGNNITQVIITSSINGSMGCGCIGNSMRNTILSVNFIKNKSHGKILGNNSGGLCGGGDNYGSGSGCIGNRSNFSTINISFYKCKSEYINGNNCGGLLGGGNNMVAYFNTNIFIVGGGCIGNYSGNNSINNITFNKCETETINGHNSGGLLGGGDNSNNNYVITYGAGCIGNSSISSNINFTITNCIIKNKKLNIGNNSGGLCGGGNNNSHGGGCIDNNSSSIISVLFNNNDICSKFSGNNCGGILGGGDNIGNNTIGGGCILNASQNNTTNFNFSNNNICVELNGKNSGGMLAGGDLFNNYPTLTGNVPNTNNVYGGGCIANSLIVKLLSTNSTTVNFINNKVCGKIYGENSGGLCGGGNSNSNDITSSHSNGHSNDGGGGCIGNSCIVCSLIVSFTDCNFKGTIKGNNSGGILGGGSNKDTNGSGCIANAMTIYNSSAIINVTLTKCKSDGNIIGSNIGGILGGGDNINSYQNILVGGGGCIANYLFLLSYNTSNTPDNINVNIDKCESNTELLHHNNGGISAGGFSNATDYNQSSVSSYVSYDNGIGCNEIIQGTLGMGIIFNSNNSINVIIQNSSTSGNIIGNGSGGISSRNIGIFYPSSVTYDMPINVTIQSCNSLCSHIGKGDNVGGICGGNVNGTNSFINILIADCYSIGKIADNAAGILGTYVNSPEPNLYLTIEYCYSVGKNVDGNGYYIYDQTQNANIIYCYYYPNTKQLMGRLQNLPLIYWKRQHDKLPILVSAINNKSVKYE